MKKTIALAGAVLMALPAALSAQQVSGGFQLGRTVTNYSTMGDAPYTLNYAEVGVAGLLGGVGYGITFDASQTPATAFINPEFTLRDLSVTLPVVEGWNLVMGKIQMAGTTEAMQNPLTVLHGKTEMSRALDARHAGVAFGGNVAHLADVSVAMYNHFEPVVANGRIVGATSEGKVAAAQIGFDMPLVQGVRVNAFGRTNTTGDDNNVYGADVSTTIKGVRANAEYSVLEGVARGTQLQAAYSVVEKLELLGRWDRSTMEGAAPIQNATAGMSYDWFSNASLQATYVRGNLAANEATNTVHFQITTRF